MTTDLAIDLNRKQLTVALAGNPNSGKTTLFNALTGSRQKVGNYPGVTVEKRTGGFRLGQTRVEVVDLPGTYSLSSFSPEERIAQDEVLTGRFDVVVVVVDSTALKRSLVLLAQIMQTGANPVLCLNMSDEADQAGQVIDQELMQELLGFPVVRTVGHRGVGVDELRRAIATAAMHPVAQQRLVLGGRLEAAIGAIREHLEGACDNPAGFNWVATRLLLNDATFVSWVKQRCAASDEALRLAEQWRRRIERETRQDMQIFLTERYFGFVDGLLREVVRQRPRADARAFSDSLDRILVHRYFGLPLFFAVVYGIFWVTFTVGEIPMDWIERGFNALGAWISGLWPAGVDSPLQSLIVDGVIAGVGGVLVFLPNILLLFFGLAFLEDTGYMSRAAFLMDRIMHRFGLHGKSFVPMMTGFGCSIPGIMATRTLENERDRLTTMLVLPLMSCGARLPIWMLLIPAFFPPVWRAPMLFFIYGFGIVLALLLALLLRKSILRGEEAPFVMELPPYRFPTLRAMITTMLERGWLYMRKAGTVILGVSILLWCLTAYPKKSHYDVDAQVAAGAVQMSPEQLRNARAAEDLRNSVAGRVGGLMEPLIRPLGFDWKMGTAMIGAFAAKEVFVSQIGIVYAIGEADEESQDLRDQLAANYSPLTGLSLMLFLLIATPCMATIAVTRRESGSWRWALLQLGGLTGIAYLISLTVYQVGSLWIH